MTELVHAAKVIERKGVQEWRCQNCDQKLGEIIGTRIVVRAAGIMISLGRQSDVEQTCPRCGALSVLGEAA